MTEVSALQRLVKVARGLAPADLLIRNAQVVNVFTLGIEEKAVAVCGATIAGVGDYRERAEEVDAGGAYLLPGFADAHLHLESSIVSPAEFARAVVPFGTTAVFADPHEVANVLGARGIRELLRATEALPLEVFFLAPSCVPATALETAGAALATEEIAALLREARVVGLGEMMNLPGVLAGEAEALEKIAAAIGEGKVVDGHAPLLSGRDLQAYAATGVSSDHETIGAKEAREKLAAGMRLIIREGSAAKNLADLAPVVIEGGPALARRCTFGSDDVHPHDLREGHLNRVLRKAVVLGLHPLQAVQMCTLNAFEHFGLARRGAVAPGYQADLVLVRDLRDFEPVLVVKAGKKVASGGGLSVDVPAIGLEGLRGTVRRSPVTSAIFRIRAEGARARVIEVVPDQIVTRAGVAAPPVGEGLWLADPSQDLLKVAVIERHSGSGGLGLGFVRGFGLRRGAMASTVAHDSHNLVVVGASDEEMVLAANTVIGSDGGQAVVAGSQVLAHLPLPLAGLMSELPIAEVSERVSQLERAVRSLGCTLPSPMMTMSFLALPVIPELRLTDRGLVDVREFRLVPLRA